MHDQSDALWLGSAIIPRRHAVCDAVLDDPTASALIINDLQLDDRFADRWFVKNPPHARFYAAVPLKSPTGNIIGVYCVVDGVPRDGLDETQTLFMEDVAAAVVSYLGTCRAQDNNRKAEVMVRGLTSFVTGAADIQNSDELDVPRDLEDPSNSEPLPRRSPPLMPPNKSESSGSSLTANDDEVISLRNHILPSGAKRMFARAANIMRESSDLQGVIIFDASMANPSPSEKGEDADTPSGEEISDTEAYISASYTGSSSGSDPPSESSEGRAASCRILGFADAGRSSRDGSTPRRDYLGLGEEALKQLLARHPNGKIFNIWRSGQGIPHQRTKKGKSKRSTAVDAIVDVAHNARSAAIIPLWDYERGRWFAGCLCWVSTPNRLLTHGADLLYLRAFGNSIMNELSRLDAAAVDQAKSTFIESMSHEMRSPLHGILGGVEYLNDMPMDAFQANIINSIAMCGRTLLDTVQNVLEYSKINELVGPGGQGQSGPPDWSGVEPVVDICQLTEETVEAVFAGKSYTVLSTDTGAASPQFSPGAQNPVMTETAARKPVRIILDLPPRPSWDFAVRPGIWRRILMNVFGNALKFTERGFIKVSLAAVDTNSSHTEITLTVADTGVGMSPQYVQDGLFKPFSQEMPFSPGIGLGMSIVRRLVQSIGGEIDVKSEARVGTQLKIRVTFPTCTSPTEDFASAVAKRTRNKRIAVIDAKVQPSDPELTLSIQSEQRFHESLVLNLKTWFGVNIVNSDEDFSSDSSHLVIYPSPSFYTMFKKRSRRGVSVVVALDALEAATLKADERVAHNWIEVVTQPYVILSSPSNPGSKLIILCASIGPFKLSRILDRYLSRLDAHSNAPELMINTPGALTPGPESTSYQFPIRPSFPSSRPSAAEMASPMGSDVEAHEQQPQVESSPRPVTPVTEIRVPSSPTLSPKSGSGQREQSDHRPESPEGREIMIVDDNPLNLRLLAVFLNKNGLSHASATNGLTALELYKENPRRWAAILMDLSMPVMDGMTATKEIRAWEFKLALERVVSAQRGQLERETSSDSNKTLKEWKRRSREVDPDGEAAAVAQAIERGEVLDKPNPLKSADSAAQTSSEAEFERGRDDSMSEGTTVPQSPMSDTMGTEASDDERPAPPLVPPPSEQERRTASASSGVPIIVITGLGSATARFEAMNAGADVFMTKPIQFSALMKTLKGRMSG